MSNYYYAIKKILNNNVVISQDENGAEVIVMGSGIRFKCHVGDRVNPDKILKVYELRSRTFKNRFETLLEEISFDCFQLTEQIISYSEKMLNKKLQDNLILSLADHINFAVIQYGKGEQRASLMNEEIKRLYKDEYNVGKDAVKMINDFYNINLLPNEAASIAFHLINAESNNSANDTAIILNGTNEILQIIESTTGEKLCEDTLSYSRLIIHLKYFIKRVIIEGENCDEQFGKVLFNEDDEQFIEVRKCIDNISAYLKDTYNYKLVEAEKFYLFIHITRVLQTN